MAPIEAIVFDFDGVVVDSEPLYEKAEIELFSSYGIDVCLEDIKDTKGLAEKMYLGIIRDRYKITAPIEEMTERGRKILKRIFATELNYIPGFLEFFKKINTQLSSGLATSSSRSLLNWIFENTRIQNHFRHSVTADDVINSKPNPEPYRKICRLIGARPENTIVIEDSIHGLKSAKSAGALTIVFIGSRHNGNFPDADYRASNYQQIEKQVQAIIEDRKVNNPCI